MLDNRRADKDVFLGIWYWWGVAVLMMGGHTVYAKSQESAPSLEMAETYTDNLRLAPVGLKEEDYITRITPGIVLHTAGSRLKAEAVYRLENIFYANTSGADSSYHMFQGNAAATVVDDTFFIDAGASVGRQNVLFTAPLALDNLSVTGNRENVATMSLSPYLQRTFRTLASVELRDTWNKVEYEGGNLYGSESNAVSAAIDSGPYFSDVSWHVDYRFESVKYRHLVDADTDFEYVSGDVRYKMTEKVSLLGKAGYEDNRYPTSPLRERPRGAFWSAGGSWEITPRTHLEGSAGERFYGLTHELLLRHRTRRSTLEADYKEEVSSTRNLQLEKRIFAPINPLTGEPLMNESGELPLLIEVQIPTISEETFIRKRAQGTWNMRAGKSTVDIELYSERHEFQKNPGRERTAGGDVAWVWQFAGRARLITRAGVQETDFRDKIRKDKVGYWSIGISRQIRPEVVTSMDIRHTAVDSNVSGAGYGENRFTLQLNVRF